MSMSSASGRPSTASRTIPPTRYRRWPAASKRCARGRTAASTGSNRWGITPEGYEPAGEARELVGAGNAGLGERDAEVFGAGRRGQRVLLADHPVLDELDQRLLERLH